MNANIYQYTYTYMYNHIVYIYKYIAAALRYDGSKNHISAVDTYICIYIYISIFIYV